MNERDVARLSEILTQNYMLEIRMRCPLKDLCELPEASVSSLVDSENRKVVQINPSINCVDTCPMGDDFTHLGEIVAKKTLKEMGTEYGIADIKALDSEL